MTRCLLALGSNLGDRAAMLREAVRAVADLPACQVIARSRWHETTPVGGPDGQEAFLNGALLLETNLGPQELGSAILRIERALGRKRTERWDARTIDLDLLLYGTEAINTPGLVVPHPRMSYRRFALEPAAEIAGEMVHAGSGWTIGGLLTHLRAAPRYVAITAVNAAIAEWLASQLARLLGCPRLEETQPNSATKGASGEASAIKSADDALGLLQRSHWQNERTLSTRLTGVDYQNASDRLPVVSGFWWDALVAGRSCANFLDCPGVECLVKPALVIAIDQEHSENFFQKINKKKVDKNFVFSGLSRQDLCERIDRSGIGPLARIQANDPAVVIQEAVAAIHSAWL